MTSVIDPNTQMMTNFAIMFPADAGAGQPPLPEEPTFPRRRPERPDHSFYIVVGGLLLGSLAVNYIIHRLENR